MRYVRDQTGRFGERPHYEPDELDVMFEDVVIGFLKGQHGKVEFPITTNDLTVLIEQDTDDLDPYADLSGYGETVEGVTEFLPGRKPRVRIARDLAEAGYRENRYRTTLTHKYGHYADFRIMPRCLVRSFKRARSRTEYRHNSKGAGCASEPLNWCPADVPNRDRLLS